MSEIPKELWPDHNKCMQYYTIERNKEIDEKNRVEALMSYKQWNDSRRYMICQLVDFQLMNYNKICARTNDQLAKLM